MLARGSVIVDMVDSPALRDNPHGDPAQRPLPGLPAAQLRRRARPPLPGDLLAPGFAGTALGALNHDPWAPSLPEAMDQALALGGPEAILVAVDGFTRFGGSQYLNSPANGRYEDYVVRDVVAHVDARYRTLPEAAARGIAGKSSGGYAALVLGMRHPETFGGISAHSADCYFEACYKPDFPKLLRAIGRHGSVEAVLRPSWRWRRSPASCLARSVSRPWQWPTRRTCSGRPTCSICRSTPTRAS